MKTDYDILGIGIGPFHLSLAAMLEKIPSVNALFLEQREAFSWHPEIIFEDAEMQTSYYKDLVTPVDPTSRHSYLNYLVEHGLFYSFMNTNRRTITRKEFELYGKWVSSRLENLKFGSSVKNVSFDGKNFVVETNDSTFTSKHLSVATGSSPYTPECAVPFLGENVFHPKSGKLTTANFEGKRVLIVGGGQTGVEVFRNAIHSKWGRPQSVKLVSRRNNLEPLDETPFTNDYFTPSYGEEFYPLDQNTKSEIVSSQKLASDGNTPAYLELLYKDLYFMRHVYKDSLDFEILPKRNLVEMSQEEDKSYRLTFINSFVNDSEIFEADIVIMATGLKNTLPKAVEGIRHLLHFDEKERPVINRSFRMEWDGPAENKIYGLNLSRHSHGISEPQTSLMAWRSAMIVNDLIDSEFYNTRGAQGFLRYGKK